MKILKKIKETIKIINIKCRYFSIINFILTIIFTYMSLGLMFDDTYGGGIGLAAGVVIILIAFIFTLSFFTYISNCFLPKYFIFIRKINKLIIINSYSFLIINIIFFSGFFHNIFDYTSYINTILISHIIIFIILIIIDYRFKNILEIKIIKYFNKILTILIVVFTGFISIRITILVILDFLIIPLLEKFFNN